MNPLRSIHILIGLVVSLVSVPLILRKVPMNHLYGVRIQKAFASPQNWYSINAYGGKLLLVYGLLLVAYGVFASPFAPDPRSIWSLLFVVGPLLVVIPLLALISSYARRLP